ncbi:hypothetical protein Tco_1327476 [Tanacetum coccineum]
MEKVLGSTKSPTGNWTLDIALWQALRNLEKVTRRKLLSYLTINQKSEVQHDSRELTSKGKEKVDDNGPRKFPITRNMMSSINGELSVTSKDKALAAADIVATSTLPGVSRTPALVEPPKKKRAFQMSAPEDDSFETDDDDETQVNGTFSRTPALVENNKQMFPEVVKVLEQAEPKESEKPVSSPKIDVGFGGSVSEQGLGFKLRASPPLTSNTQNNFLPQATLPMDNVVPERDSNSFPLFGTSAERASPFASSANGLSYSKPSACSNPKALESTRLENYM